MSSRAKKNERWAQWQKQEREQERAEQRERVARSKGRSLNRENMITVFQRRLVTMQEVCAHLGVRVRVLNHGVHVQFLCEDLIGNFYPTTNRMYMQRPGLGKTIGGIKHRDALLAFFHAAREVLDLSELYTASWDFNSRDNPPLRVYRAATDIGTRLREAVLCVAAKRPQLLHHVDPTEFEHLVAELLRDDGYAASVTQATRDGGRDIVAIRSLEGGDEFVLLVECKRFVEKPVDIAVVQRVVGVRHINRANHAMVVTTSRFTGPAYDEALRVHDELSLVDQQHLHVWLAKYDARRKQIPA